MLKHGVENFNFEILIICFDEDVVRFEKEYIQKYNSIQPNGYNILLGGQLGDGHVGFKHTPETIERIKEKGRIFREKNPNHYETYRKKHKETMKTINLSECIKQSNKFQKAMMERREQFKNGTIKISEETKEKIRKSVLKHYQKHGSGHLKSSQKHIDGINRTISKPVAQYTKEGALVKEYISIAEADRITGIKANNIGRALSKSTSTAGGFHWKYLPRSPSTLSQET